jgi:hypothetical protein
MLALRSGGRDKWWKGQVVEGRSGGREKWWKLNASMTVNLI